MSAAYDLAVAYRVYPGVSKTPLLHAGDKLRLAELCLRSFHAAAEGLRVKVWAILDGCPPAYEALFRHAFAAADLEVVSVDAVGNYATFAIQLDRLLAQRDAEHVLLAEDDYLYLPSALRESLEFLRASPDADYVSPYDHSDYYSVDIHRHRNELRAFGGRHWRTANSTTLTFLTTRAALARDERAFRTYAHGNPDVSIWLALTKEKVRNPLVAARYLLRDRLMFRCVAKSWIHNWRSLLAGGRRRLWTPVPSLATHLESPNVAPGIDWHAVAEGMDVSPRRTANASG